MERYALKHVFSIKLEIVLILETFMLLCIDTNAFQTHINPRRGRPAERQQRGPGPRDDRARARARLRGNMYYIVLFRYLYVYIYIYMHMYWLCVVDLSVYKEEMLYITYIYIL